MKLKITLKRILLKPFFSLVNVVRKTAYDAMDRCLKLKGFEEDLDQRIMDHGLAELEKISGAK